MKRINIIIGILISTVILISLLIFWLISRFPPKLEIEDQNLATLTLQANTPTSNSTEEYLETNLDYSFDIPHGYKYVETEELPDFIEIKEDKILVKAQKYSNGNYVLKFEDSTKNSLSFILHIQSPKLDFESLEVQISQILGDKKDNYTIHLKNLLNDQRLDINQGKIVEPASIAKLPVAVLVLRDIDEGKITLDDTFAYKNAARYGSGVGNLGDVEEDTPITFRTYLEELIYHSDNNAWFMLIHYLGGNFQEAIPRTIDELGVNPLFLDPPQGTAQNVGKILEDIYNHSTLSESLANYLISLMEDADEWARAGIGLGIPSEGRFVNKIGTLDDSGKMAYEDGAIIWGEKTDYVLVIMNENTDWGSGQEMLKNISKLVYEFLNK